MPYAIQTKIINIILNKNYRSYILIIGAGIRKNFMDSYGLGIKNAFLFWRR